MKIPEGPKAGQLMKLAPFQRKFIRGALGSDIRIACLSVGRGAAKTALSSAIALAAFLGVFDPQPNRDVVIAARTRDQGAIAFQFVLGFLRSLPEELQKTVKIRRAPRLELEIETETGRHILRVIASDGMTALGSSPTFVLMDERGHWDGVKGDDLEAALLSGLGKRAGRALIISTSARDDAHPFSIWLDNPGPGIFIQEHRPLPGLPADDPDSLKEANPGAEHGIGSSLEWLQSEAKRAIARGGQTLISFRLYNRNERVSAEARDVLLTTDEWLACEVDELPPRSGDVVVGIDLGGSASMSGVAFYWPDTSRLEAYGTFPGLPSLESRGEADGVKGRYVEMHLRGELNQIGKSTVPVADWLRKIISQIDGEKIAALVADGYKKAEISEALVATGFRCPIIWRRMVWQEASEDCDRFRRAAFDGEIACDPSLLMRSALADAVVLTDASGNIKIAKGRSTGRIDALAAAVLAVAQGARIKNGAVKKSRVVWA